MSFRLLLLIFWLEVLSKNKTYQEARRKVVKH
ncbi:hypothetical protein GLYMA_13G124066v4 [Glycine max]|nr:hypothetical protein GLYMA_13G124066v4 [Glycine max]KAH1101149.1 hypothetical protein GYH30_035976 [Glycine max]